MVEGLKNMDWALFVAVLSLLFTGVVSFITIRYTKRSLDYTKESTRIAEESLQAAQKSIETSLELYEKQKKDDEVRRIKENNNEIKALKTIIYDEVKNNYGNFKFVDDFIKITLEDNLIKFVHKTMVDKPYIDYSTDKEESILVPLKIHSTKVMDNYLLDVSRLDEKLIDLLIETRRLTYNYNEAFLLGFNDFLSKKPSSMAVKIYLKETKRFHESYKDSCLLILDYCSDAKIKTNVI